MLDIPAVFAGLLTVILIVLAVENLVSRTVEQTVRRWGGAGLNRPIPPALACNQQLPEPC